MYLLIPGLLIFFAMHSVFLWTKGGDALRGRLGRPLYIFLFSGVNVGALFLIIVGYGLARQDPVLLWSAPLWMHHVVFLLMLPVFILVIATYVPGRIKARLGHPVWIAIKIWAFAHLMVNGTLADLFLFGGFLVWSVVGMMHSRRCQQNILPDIASDIAPNGPVDSSFATNRNDVLAIGSGFIVYLLFLFWLHGQLMGVALIG